MLNSLFQLFILGLEGDNLKTNPNFIYSLKNDLGGVIFFTQNIISENNFVNLVNDIKNYSSKKLFLSIDQEGGRVERTENIHNGKKYKSAMFIAKDGFDALAMQTENIAKELKHYGLNMNFAPVCDVNSNPNNPIIGERSYGNTPEFVAQCAEIVSKIYLRNNIIPVAKHFAGHGDTTIDSHLSLPTVELDFKELEKIHIYPFKKNLHIPAFMVSHVHYKAFDEKEMPATLSKNVIQNYLIKQLNYNGIIISDDMVMGALKKYNPVEAILLGLEAGLDMFIYRLCDDKIIEIIHNVYDECKHSNFMRKKIENSAEKIYRIKKSML